MCMFDILLVLCLLVIQCGCHWSELKATFLLNFKITSSTTTVATTTTSTTTTTTTILLQLPPPTPSILS